MKTFIIIMLSISIALRLIHVYINIDDEDGSALMTNLLFFAAYILALIFACQLH